MPNNKLLRCVKRTVLGGLLGLSLLVYLDFSSTVIAAEKTDADSPVLRQGLPGRRMGGGTRERLPWRRTMAQIARGLE